MSRRVSASSRSVRRSRRPQSTPRNFMHENRETSGMPAGPVSRRTAGEGSGRTWKSVLLDQPPSLLTLRRRAFRPCSSDSSVLCRCVTPRRRARGPLARTRLRAGLRVSHGWASVRTGCSLGRYSSKIRTGCAKERPSGSVRGAVSNDSPYRDLKTRDGHTVGAKCG